MINKREAKQIIDFVIREIKKSQFPYTTDGRIDFNRTTAGSIGGGTSITGGQLGNEIIYNRHVNPNADIDGTKIKVATIYDRGAVEFAEDLETVSGIAVQANDSRLHDTVCSGSAQHDVRYWTKSQLASTVSGYGARSIGVEDPYDYFEPDNLEEVLWELREAIDLAIIGSGVATHGNEAHSPDFAIKDAEKRIMYVRVIDLSMPLIAGDSTTKIIVSSELNGMNLINAHAAIYSVSTSGLPTIQIHNLTDTVDMLTTPITIDVGELSSYTALTQPEIDVDNDDVVTGDVLRVDVDGAGTSVSGLDVILTFTLP